MVDDVKSLRRNKKIAGIEDPIVIVQRLLNVFRQLHILDEKQKTEFDNMVLQQPPEIRHMCTTLPGGSLLQEYVDELEEKNGIAPDQVVSGEHLVTTNQENILANALAQDNQEQTETKPVSSPVSPESTMQTAATPSAAAATVNTESLELQKQMLQMMQAMQAQNAQAQAQMQAQTQMSAPISAPVSTTIKADANFAKDIASALSSALAETDEKRHQETLALTKSISQSQMEMTKTLIQELTANQEKSTFAPMATADGNNVKIIDNTKEITKAITDSQLEMAKMFLQQNAISASNSNANNANNIQINNVPSPALNTQELVGDIIKAQSQLFREMAREQTKELSAIISVALKESHQLSSKTLIEALSAFQKENLNFFKQQAKNQTVIYQQAPMAAMAPVPMAAGDTVGQPVYSYAEQQPQMSDDADSTEPSYIKKMLGNMFNRAHNQDSDKTDLPQPENFSPTLENDMPQVEYEYVEVPVEETAAEPQNYQTEDNNEEEDSYEISSDGLGLSTLSSPTKKKKKKKKKKKNNGLIDNEMPQQEDLSPADRELHELLDFNENPPRTDVDTQQSSDRPVPAAVRLDTSLFDLDTLENETTESATQVGGEEKENNDFSKLDMSILEKDLTSAKDNSNNGITQDAEWKEISSQEQFDAEEVNESEIFLAEDININSNDNESAEFNSGENNTTDSTDSYHAQRDVFQSVHTSLIPDLQNQETMNSLLNHFNSSLENDEPLDLEADYKIALDTNDKGASETADDNSDWEWEYEEIPEGEEPTQPQIETASESDNSDWEWEYEEIPEGEEPTQPQIETASESDDGDWEWEYEEIPEGEEPAQPQVETAAENDDGDWEWEYEEIPEGEESAQPQVETAGESDDGDWEWEYEEIPEGEEPVQPQVETAAESDDGNRKFSDGENALSDSMESQILVQPVDNLSQNSPSSFPDDEMAALFSDDSNQPQETSILSANQEDVDFSDLFKNYDNSTLFTEDSIQDPYSGRNLEDDDLGIMPLQSGSLYFQEDIASEPKEALTPKVILPETGDEIVFAEIGDDENKNEPYALNSDLKP